MMLKLSPQVTVLTGTFFSPCTLTGLPSTPRHAAAHSCRREPTAALPLRPCPRNVPLPATAGGGLARHVRVDACLLRLTQLPMLAAAPRVQPAVARDAQRMRSTACDVRDLLAFRHHHERRHGHAPAAAEPQLPVVARPPRVDLRPHGVS
jgi:hypothetical protein